MPFFFFYVNVGLLDDFVGLLVLESESQGRLIGAVGSGGGKTLPSELADKD